MTYYDQWLDLGHADEVTFTKPNDSLILTYSEFSQIKCVCSETKSFQYNDYNQNTNIIVSGFIYF